MYLLKHEMAGRMKELVDFTVLGCTQMQKVDVGVKT